METSIEKARSKVGFDTCMTGVCYKSAMGKVWMEAGGKDALLHKGIHYLSSPLGGEGALPPMLQPVDHAAGVAVLVVEEGNQFELATYYRGKGTVDDG